MLWTLYSNSTFILIVIHLQIKCQKLNLYTSPYDSGGLNSNGIVSKYEINEKLNDLPVYSLGSQQQYLSRPTTTDQTGSRSGYKRLRKVDQAS